MGHNSKHTINKTIKEFHLFNQNPERRRPTNPLTPEALGHGRITAEVLARQLPGLQLYRKGRSECTVGNRVDPGSVSGKCLK